MKTPQLLYTKWKLWFSDSRAISFQSIKNLCQSCMCEDYIIQLQNYEELATVLLTDSLDWVENPVIKKHRDFSINWQTFFIWQVVCIRLQAVNCFLSLWFRISKIRLNGRSIIFVSSFRIEFVTVQGQPSMIFRRHWSPWTRSSLLYMIETTKYLDQKECFLC